jgi:hypothetical protein
VNYMRFALSALYLNEFAGQNYSCTNCTFRTGDAVLVSLDISPTDSVVTYFLYMLACFCTFHILAWISLTCCYTGFFRNLADKFRARRTKRSEDAAENV